jgi:hypothetical protein
MQEKILSTLATEALKPASSAIDALLGAKLERIRISAKKRELRDRLQDSRINDLLEDYFRRLLARVSEIKTLVFPEQVIPITSIYEPLRLTPATGKDFHVKTRSANVNLSAKDLKPNQNYLIIDSAGMGKSTFSKYLILDIFESTTKIPLFLELRRIDDNESLSERLSKDIDPNNDDVNEELLKLMLGQGGYIVILDGYDEISENARKKINPQISELAMCCEQNTIVLTSRPQVGLPEIPKSIVYNIQPLRRKQAESLVLRYDNFANIDVGKRLINHFDNVSEEFLETPLLLVLLYKTYGYNQSIATNVASFYDDVYNAFYKGHDLTKAGFSRPKLSNLDQEDFRRLLRGFSFLLLTEGKYSIKSRAEGHAIIEKAVKLTLITPSSIPNFFEDLLVTVPFLISDGGEYRFVHKSIAEFFAAEFLAFAPDAENKIKIITQSSLTRTFNEPLNFILQLNPSLFRRAILAPAARAYLKTKTLSNDPFCRTLLFCGITHVGISEERDPTKADFFAPLDRKSSKRLGFRAEKKHTQFPSSIWSFLGNEAKRDDESRDTFESRSDDFSQLLMIKNFVSVTSKSFKKFTSSKYFIYISTSLLSYLQNSKNVHSQSYWILNEQTCKSVLKTIQEERKAQSQIDAAILQSK